MAYRTDKQRAAIAAQNEDRELLIRIKALIGVVGSMETVATLAGVSPQTFRRRMKSPGDFTRSEIRALARIERKEYGKEGEPWLIA